MISTELLQTEKAIAMAIENKDALIPNMPVVDYLQEAANLISVAATDKSDLQAVNIDWQRIERLEAAIEVLRDAQTNLLEQRKEDQEARAQWKIEYPKAEALKLDILQTMRFVYNNDSQSLARVAEITRGDGYNDTIHDLHDCALKGRKDITRFQAINYPVENFEQADKLSNSLMLLLSRMNGSSTDDNQVKIDRDKAYTNLKQITDYLRRYGKYVYRNNSEKAARYTISYFQH